MIVNKTEVALDARLNLEGIGSQGNASVVRYGPVDLTRIVKGANLPFVDNILATTLPAQSISLVEIAGVESILPPAAYLPLVAR